MNKYIILSALLLSLNPIKADDRTCCTSECPMPAAAPTCPTTPACPDDRTCYTPECPTATPCSTPACQSETPAPAICGDDIMRMSPNVEGVQIYFDCRWPNCCKALRTKLVKAIIECVEKCQQPNITPEEQNKAIDKMIRCCRKEAAMRNENDESQVSIQTSIIIIAPEDKDEVQEVTEQETPAAQEAAE